MKMLHSHLPKIPATGRWSYKIKASIVACVADHRLTQAEAMARYGLSYEEISEWASLFAARGLQGLKTSLRPRRYGNRLKAFQRQPDGRGTVA